MLAQVIANGSFDMYLDPHPSPKSRALPNTIVAGEKHAYACRDATRKRRLGIQLELLNILLIRLFRKRKVNRLFEISQTPASRWLELIPQHKGALKIVSRYAADRPIALNLCYSFAWITSKDAELLAQMP